LPRLFLLDEPCAGLSPEETQHLSGVIARTVRALGASALIVEHDMAAVEALADRVYVLHQGRLLAAGSYAEIRADADVQAVYAGGRK
jgi:branched-chain amino acid transport system permease protein